MAKDFSHLYKIIYDYFLKHPDSSTLGTSRRAFAKWLDVSTGKAQAWEDKGQWPSAEDLETLHKKMGFSYRCSLRGKESLLMKRNHLPKSACAQTCTNRRHSHG